MKTPERPTDLIPINIIRTETLFRLPLHHLTRESSKKGPPVSDEIRIIRRDPATDRITHYWLVQPNPKVGTPHQLSYKLDTLIINRKIDELPKPFPRIMRLGSLRAIGRELGLREEDTDRIRQALEKNSAAYLSFRLPDPTQKGGYIEGKNNRYGLIIQGMELPNGQKAETVYIVWNDPFYSLLNNAPTRPLNYDYLKRLAPAHQRFYEILSYRIFYALKHKLPEAALRYSDYCLESTQVRYYTRPEMQKQMYKIHREHKNHGYIDQVRYHPTTDFDSKPDWIMYYTPGPKAQAEYNTFNEKTQGVIEVAPEPIESQAQLPAPQPDAPLDPQLLELLKRGIMQKVARQLLASLAPGQEVLDQLEYGDYVISQGGIERPTAFYVWLIRENITPPDDFATSRRRELQKNQEHARQKSLFQEQELQDDYKLYRQEQTEKYIKEHFSDEDYQHLFKTHRKRMERTYPKMIGLFEKTLDDLAHAELRKQLREQVPLPSFDEWKKQHTT